MTIEWIPAAAKNWESARSRVCTMAHGIAVHHLGWKDEPGKPRQYFTIDGSISHFQKPRPAAPSSAQFLVADERVVQMVPLLGVAWHGGPLVNGIRVGIEHDPLWSDKTYLASATLAAALLRLRGLPADSNTIRGHGDLVRGADGRPSTLCPGNCDMTRYREEVRRAQESLSYVEFVDIVRQLRF